MPSPHQTTPARALLAALALACAFPAVAQDLQEFTSQGLPRSQGLVVRVNHPVAWKRVAPDDDMALAELRGPQGRLTGILQVGRGLRRDDIASACRPERARTMLQTLADDEADAVITDVFARTVEGRPAFELRYQRRDGASFLAVRSVIVCLKDTRVVVSCGALGSPKAALAEIEPVCSRVLDSLAISED